ncbi:TPA: LysR family transcriptional regulator [Pseudomonas aeruginosa]|nr:LysR family transcriptional regulator [Pseudomonas aeruginosa]
MHDFTLHDLQCFDAVVDAGGFQAAAQRLHRSHPAVFAAVARLERQLGLVLLERGGYRVGLTAAGRSFHQRAQTLLYELEGLRGHAAHLAQGEESELRVVLGDLCPPRPALALLAGFFGSQPQTRLQLLFETVSGPLERLLDGEADLILHRVDKSDPRLEWLDLCRVGLVPVIAPGLLGDPPPRPVRPEQLRPFAQCVMRDSARHSPPTDYFMLAGARQCSVPDQRTKKEVILQGLGWGHLPDFLIDEELADGRLLALAGPHLPGRSEEVVAARRRDRAQGPVAERLWAFLRDNATALRESGMDTGGDDSAGARRPR